MVVISVRGLTGMEKALSMLSLHWRLSVVMIRE